MSEFGFGRDVRRGVGASAWAGTVIGGMVCLVFVGVAVLGAYHVLAPEPPVETYAKVVGFVETDEIESSGKGYQAVLSFVDGDGVTHEVVGHQYVQGPLEQILGSKVRLRYWPEHPEWDFEVSSDRQSWGTMAVISAIAAVCAGVLVCGQWLSPSEGPEVAVRSV